MKGKHGVPIGAKIASLENCENGLLFSSGIAAIFSTMFSFIKSGDHVVFQSSLYGGTINMIFNEFKKFKIDYTLVESLDPIEYQKAIKQNTKMIYVETPSNPLLEIIDLKQIADIAKKNNW